MILNKFKSDHLPYPLLSICYKFNFFIENLISMIHQIRSCV
jgi:hypothetical protein